MPVTNREQLITILGRITATADRPATINAVLDYLYYTGQSDVGAALVTSLNATSTVLTGTLDQAIVAKLQNRAFSAHTHHGPV